MRALRRRRQQSAGRLALLVKARQMGRAGRVRLSAVPSEDYIEVDAGFGNKDKGESKL